MPEVDWTQANCRDVDPEMMFPPSGRANKQLRKEAKAVCRGQDGRNTCPIRELCRDYAVEQGDFWSGGIWGGLSDRERRAYAKKGIDAAAEADSRPVKQDARTDGRQSKSRDKTRRPDRKNAAGSRGRDRGAKKAGRPARQRTGEVVVLSTRRLPTNHGCDTARGLGEDAVAGDLRGRSRRPRQVAAMGPAPGSAIRSVAVRRLRIVMDGDIT